MEEALNEDMVTMKNSGYSEQYRFDTLVNTVKGFRRKLTLDSEGVKPLYREAHEGARERFMARIGAAANWFKRGDLQ